MEENRVIIPRVSANEDSVVLVEWKKANGDQIRKGDVLCILETSKALFDLESDFDGWLFHVEKPNSGNLTLGDTIGFITRTKTPPVMDPTPQSKVKTKKFTKKALTLLEESGIPAEDIPKDGLIRERDILAYKESTDPNISAGSTNRIQGLTAIQKRMADTLIQSINQVPQSTLVKEIDAESLEESVNKLSDEHEVTISVSDWLMVCVSKSIQDHSMINSSWTPNGIVIPDDINIGFALNQSNGELLVPVVKNVNQMDFLEIIGNIKKMQVNALRNRLTPSDLSEGTVTVTSLVGTGVHQIFPLVVPGQTAIIGMADINDLRDPAIYALSVTFDHRTVNGSQVAAFMNDLSLMLIGD